jgi:nucleoside-diphosphate-sugar epimerase
MNKILETDFQYIANSKIQWDKMDNKNVFITGGTGFLGSLLIHFFDYLNVKLNRNIKVIALVRDEKKAKRVIGDCNVTLVKGDICNMPALPMDINFIFHCAAVTNSKTMIEEPVEVSQGIIIGTYNLMKLSYEKKVESVVYFSSMEIYGNVNLKSNKASEKDLGVIDIFSARSCYPMGKRMAENICFNFHLQYGVPVKIARLAQTFGAGILKTDNRVFAQFAQSVIEKKDIILHTTGESDTNCCYTADAIIALIILLLNGENGEAYNITNEANHMSVREMAELVAEKVANGNISVKLDISEKNIYGYPPPVKLYLSSKKMNNLGWNPRIGLEEMYRRMIEYMRN